MSGGAAGLQSWEQADVLPHNGPSSGNLADILERVVAEQSHVPDGPLDLRLLLLAGGMQCADRAFEPLHLLPLPLEDAAERLIESDATADGTPGFSRVRDRVLRHVFSSAAVRLACRYATNLYIMGRFRGGMIEKYQERRPV